MTERDRILVALGAFQDAVTTALHCFYRILDGWEVTPLESQIEEAFAEAGCRYPIGTDFTDLSGLSSDEDEEPF